MSPLLKEEEYVVFLDPVNSLACPFCDALDAPFLQSMGGVRLSSSYQK